MVHGGEEGGFETLIRATVRSPRGGRETAVVREWKVTAPWQGELALDSTVPWGLEAIAPGYWAAPHELQSGSGRGGVSFYLFSLGRISGLVRSSEETYSPRRVTAEVQSATAHQDGGRLGPTIPHAVFACSTAGARWACEVPGGRLDLRVEFDNFVPVYFWGREVEPGQELELENIDLQPGSSLAGWVETAVAAPDDSSVEVTLKPQLLGWNPDPGERQRLARRALHTRADERGFFQFKAIAPGGYSLEASKAGFSSIEIQSLTVERDQELIVPDPIVLSLPARIDLYLDPPVDAAGEPWVVTLMRPEALTSIYHLEDRSAATLEGYWQGKPLSPGSYRIEIRDSLGSPRLAQDVELGAEMQPLFLTLDTVAIKGYITSGEEPLRTEVVFGTTQGRPYVRLSSDANGRFEGSLPREGEWPVEISVNGGAQIIPSVEVARKPGRSFAIVEIALPDTTLTGHVMDGNEPATDAFILVKGGEGKREKAANLVVDEEGAFELRGLPAGEYAVSAYRSGQTSDWSRVELREHVPGPHVRLDLEPKIEITGRVVAASGTGVPGARVQAMPASSAETAWSAQAATDMKGDFTLKISKGIDVVDLLVLASGFGLEIRRIQVSDFADSLLVVPVVQSGGRLVLPMPSGSGYTLHRDSAAVLLEEIAPLLLRSGSMRPNAAPAGGFVIESVAPGAYAICAGYLHREDLCTGGLLAAHDELVLIPRETAAE